ncbi:MAG: integrase arm-type DNA-binding domain-containing protein [Gammaproteobacteria bacterium]
MRKRLTEITVTRLKAPDSGRLEVHDTITSGFGVRVTPQGARTYFVLYRVAGDRKLRRLTLGDARKLKLADARQRAQEALALAQTGADPKARKEAAVAAERAVDEDFEKNRFSKVAELYISRYAKPNLRQWQPLERMFTGKLNPAWGERQISTITRRDVVELLDSIGDRAPVMANRVHALLSRFFGWCVEREIIDVNPVAGLKKPQKERSRDRVLTRAEIRALWAAAGEVGYPGGALVRLLLLTACRLNEIGQLTKDQVGEDALYLPETKNGRPHVLPVSKDVRSILGELPEFEGPYVLTSTAGKRPMQNFSDIKAKLDELSGVTDWTYHDLRRTAASGMAELKIPPHVIEAVLNHASGTVSGVARVYNRFDYVKEKRLALERWAAEVARVVKGKAAAKVVELGG